jgi:hypothetical protein
MTAFELMKSLPIPTQVDTLNVEKIRDGDFYASRNHKGFAGLLLRLSTKNFKFLTFSSEALEIRVRDDCNIEAHDSKEVIRALLIQPKIENMEVVIGSFADAILNYGFNNKENYDQLNDYLNRLIQLFTYKTNDNFPLNTAIGLWGELYAISMLPSLLTYWKGSEGTTFDFQEKGISLEIKASQKGRSFKIQSSQLQANAEKSFLMAINIELNYESGKSTVDLVDDIIRIIPSDHIFDFTLGLSRRGFVLGNKISNFNKPFNLMSDYPALIDLNKLNQELSDTINSILRLIEDGIVSKTEFTLNYAQVKALENTTYHEFINQISGLS